MILRAEEIADRLRASAATQSDRLIIRPQPDLQRLAESGSGSIDLRLGCWFVTLPQRRIPFLDINRVSSESDEFKLARSHYVKFGQHFILHPSSFVLGVTLEWIRLPRN